MVKFWGKNITVACLKYCTTSHLLVIKCKRVTLVTGNERAAHFFLQKYKHLKQLSDQSLMECVNSNSVIKSWKF